LTAIKDKQLYFFPTRLHVVNGTAPDVV